VIVELAILCGDQCVYKRLWDRIIRCVRTPCCCEVFEQHTIRAVHLRGEILSWVFELIKCWQTIAENVGDEHHGNHNTDTDTPQRNLGCSKRVDIPTWCHGKNAGSDRLHKRNVIVDTRLQQVLICGIRNLDRTQRRCKGIDVLGIEETESTLAQSLNECYKANL